MILRACSELETASADMIVWWVLSVGAERNPRKGMQRRPSYHHQSPCIVDEEGTSRWMVMKNSRSADRLCGCSMPAGLQ